VTGELSSVSYQQSAVSLYPQPFVLSLSKDANRLGLSGVTIRGVMRTEPLIMRLSKDDEGRTSPRRRRSTPLSLRGEGTPASGSVWYLVMFPRYPLAPLGRGLG